VGAAFGQTAEEGAVVNEAFAHGDRLHERGSGFVVDQCRVVAITGTELIVSNGGVYGEWRQAARRLSQVRAMQGRRPGIEHRLAARMAHREQQVFELLPADGDVVMVLNAEGDAEVAGASGGFAQGFDDQFPLGGIRGRGVFVASEDAQALTAEVAGEFGEFDDVGDLKFAVRDFGVFQVGGEVGVAGDDQIAQTAFVELSAQGGALGGIEVERRDVGALGHEHDAAVTEVGGMVDEGADIQGVLTPESGVRNRMQQSRTEHPLIVGRTAKLKEMSTAEPLFDTFGRLHDNLRISVTDRCNIRCFYCMPETGAEYVDRAEILTFEEIERMVRIAADLGVTKIRLTGGEPLVRKDLHVLIAALNRIPGIRDIALTTNGVLLAEQAQALHDAGLRRLNVHLDTLDRERFKQITRRDDLPRVLAGIEKAQALGFGPIKMNVVAVKNLIEPDIVPMARFGREHGIEIRYIEFMPLDHQSIWDRSRVLLMDTMLEMLRREIGPLEPVPDPDPRAPATEFRFTDGVGGVGFVASVSKPFCLNCNRLRLTSDGKLRYCLFAIDETDVKGLLRAGTLNDEAIAATIRQTVRDKWLGHEINTNRFVPPPRPMHSIGG